MTTASNTTAHPQPTILPCNFRSSGRLSNDSIRQLRNMHETFARNVSHSLDLFLGSPLEIKFTSVEQIGSREFVASIPSGSYLVPFTLMPQGSRIIAKFDSALMFPLLDLLLGGTGEPMEASREMTDIDEELLRSVVELVGVQLERTWKACQVSVMPTPSIKPALAGQLFLTEERTVTINFEVTLARTEASMSLVLPMAFCNALVRSTHPESTRFLGGEAGVTLPLRERILECDMLVSAELPGLAISVGELIAMTPGTILNLHTSVETPVRLSLSQHPLFEVTPVRKGTRKTAHLGRPCQAEGGLENER